MKSFFTPKDVSTLIRISYRQIQYWDKTNFIKPSYRRKGKYRLYTFTDLIQLWVAKGLRENNYSIQMLRQVIRSLRSLLPQTSHPMVDLTVLIKERQILVCSGDVLLCEKSARDYYEFKIYRLREKIEEMFPEHVDQPPAA